MQTKMADSFHEKITDEFDLVMMQQGVPMIVMEPNKNLIKIQGVPLEFSYDDAR